MQMEHKVFSCDMKATTPDGSKWDGHANTFYCIDSAGEIVDIGAFTETLPQFLENGWIGGLGHNWEDPIGKPVNAKEDAIGLWVDALCDVDSNEARKCRDLIKKKICKKLSIGYRVKASEWLENAEEVAAYWKERGYQPRPDDVVAAQYGARLLTKIHLFEASPVMAAANDYSNIERVKQYSAEEIQTEREFERFLRDAGFPKDAAVTICVSGFKALRRRDAEDAPIENEPTPEAEAQTEQAAEVKAEETPPVETAAPESVAKLASQDEVRSLYAQLLSSKAHALSAR